MNEREKHMAVQVTLEIPASAEAINDLIADLEGSCSDDDTLSVEASLSGDAADMSADQFTLVDSEGFPLLTVTLRAAS